MESLIDKYCTGDCASLRTMSTFEMFRVIPHVKVITYVHQKSLNCLK